MTDAPDTEITQNGGARDRKQGRGDAGGAAATITFIALLAVALGLLGYMVLGR
ncbi:hypothetical protein [Streptomyces sp. NPDC005805]|uniref:hypothetical protein n=1 Tax=Streptomyces sp. NPDC005805 TaxID=3157068 RepID=UPI0033DA9E6D